MKTSIRFLLSLSLILASVSAQATEPEVSHTMAARLAAAVNDPLVQGVLTGIKNKFPESQPCDLPNEAQFAQSCKEYTGGRGCNFEITAFCKLGAGQYDCSQFVAIKGKLLDGQGATLENISFMTACP
jgi:hypothetical protein